MITLIRTALIALGLTGLSFVPIYRAYEQSRESGDLTTLLAGLCAGVLIIAISTLEKTFKKSLITAALLSLMTLPAIAVLGTYVRGPMMGLSDVASFPIFRSMVVFCAGAIIIQAFGYTCYLKSFIRYLKNGPRYKQSLY